MQKRTALDIQGGPLLRTISRGQRQARFAEGEGELVRGRPPNDRYVQDLVKRLAKRSGIEKDVHPHVLRHSAWTNLRDKARGLRLVQHAGARTASRMAERTPHAHPLSVAGAMEGIEAGEEQRRVGEPSPCAHLRSGSTRLRGQARCGSLLGCSKRTRVPVPQQSGLLGLLCACWRPSPSWTPAGAPDSPLPYPIE